MHTDKVPMLRPPLLGGSGLNGAAVQRACREVAGRMAAVAAQYFTIPVEAVRFEDGEWFTNRSIDAL